MKRLILMRHAKSDWTSDFTSDHDRPLSKRGRRAARRMGRFLAVAGEPDAVLTSSALRARATAEEAAEAGAWSAPVHVLPELYASDASSVVLRVRERGEDAQSLLMIGHEPTWSDLASRLVGGCRLRFPTAAMACVELEVERWGDVDFGAGTLVWFVTPRSLEAE